MRQEFSELISRNRRKMLKIHVYLTRKKHLNQSSLLHFKNLGQIWTIPNVGLKM